MGGIQVQLTDAFFQDPRSVKNTFVIPMRITGVVNADSVLSGKSSLPNPDRRKAGDWITQPKDYILFAIKYINPYHGTYLRRGLDLVKELAATPRWIPQLPTMLHLWKKMNCAIW